jgi:DNA-binding XRE family transcriptional regulator
VDLPGSASQRLGVRLAGVPVQVATRQQAAHLFGSNVRTARERRHLTQAPLADAAGLSKAGASLVERGGVREATPSLFTLLALARALQVPPELLLDGIERRRGSGVRWDPATCVGMQIVGRERAAVDLR